MVGTVVANLNRRASQSTEYGRYMRAPGYNYGSKSHLKGFRKIIMR
jgi:hypothetical protein